MKKKIKRLIEKYMKIKKGKHEYIPVGEVINDLRNILN